MRVRAGRRRVTKVNLRLPSQAESLLLPLVTPSVGDGRRALPRRARGSVVRWVDEHLYVCRAGEADGSQAHLPRLVAVCALAAGARGWRATTSSLPVPGSDVATSARHGCDGVDRSIRAVPARNQVPLRAVFLPVSFAIRILLPAPERPGSELSRTRALASPMAARCLAPPGAPTASSSVDRPIVLPTRPHPSLRCTRVLASGARCTQ